MLNIGWRELLKIFMSFIIAMIVVNGFLVLLLFVFTSPEVSVFEGMVNSYMYTIGYASASGFPIGLMMVQAMVGVLLTASFAALLTYRIFRRDDDITLVNKCFIMQIEDRYALSFILHNKGKAIYDVNCEIRAYDEANADDQEGETLKRYRPVVHKEKDWRITVTFDRNHQIYRYLENSLLSDELHMDVLVKSVDSGIGLQSMFHYEFKVKDIIYVDVETYKAMVPEDYLNNLTVRLRRNLFRAIPGSGNSLLVSHSFVNAVNNKQIRDEFEDYLRFKKHDFDLSGIQGIAEENKGSIELNYHQEDRVLSAILLTKAPIGSDEAPDIDETYEVPEWMGLCLPLVGKNWHYFVENHYKVYLDITSKTIKELTVEVEPIDGHSLTAAVTFEQGRGYAVIPLDDVKSIEDYETMNELRLTFKLDTEGSAEAYDLQVRKIYLSKFHF